METSSPAIIKALVKLNLQSNPLVSGEVMYCWETGGDYPQRMWYMTVKEDGQVEEGGYWHCGGTADLKWAVGDAFDGKLYRLNIEKDEEDVLLTQGHRLNSLPM